MRKSLKRITVAIACIFMMTISTFYSSAEELQDKEVLNQVEMGELTSYVYTSSPNSFTWALKVGQGFIENKEYMGFNPTVKVNARGNPNMIYKVWVVNPVGITGEVGYVRADGSTISKNLWMSIGGDYFIYVQPWEGGTNGQTVYFDFYITW